MKIKGFLQKEAKTLSRDRKNALLRYCFSKKGLALMLGFSAFFLFANPVYAEVSASDGDWVQQGESWYFMLGPNTPLENEWINYNGQSYHIGSGGLMTTGKYVDPEDKTEYFFDKDGRLLEEEFSKDGKTYIGKEGKELVQFNQYRQFLREELEKDKTKDFGKKVAVDVADPDSAEKTMEGAEIFPKSFALMDLNHDGYKDIVLYKEAVEEGKEEPKSILSIILYQEKLPEKKGSSVKQNKERSLAVLLEEEANGAYQVELRKNLWTGEAVVYRHGGESDTIFRLTENAGLEQVLSLSVGKNGSGEPEYRLFSDIISGSQYQSELQTLKNQYGEAYPGRRFNLDDAGITEGLKNFTKDELSFYSSQEDA